MKTLIEQFTIARDCSTPLIAIQTPDAAATIQSLTASMAKNAEGQLPPVFRWEVCNGLQVVQVEGNELAAGAISGITNGDPIATTANLFDCLMRLNDLPGDSVVFLHNVHLYLAGNDKKPDLVQALWNLRDRFKASGRTAVILGPILKLPLELEKDFVMLDEPLPSDDQLGDMTKALIADAKLKVGAKQIDRAVDALRGLPMFTAEQSLAMSLSREGIDQESLWEYKCRAIETQKGLTVWRDGMKFKDIGGVMSIKKFLGYVIAGKTPPRCVVFIDEIEKMLAGTAGDLSGLSQDYLMCLLTYMQNTNARGILFIGPPGAAKSAVAQAFGNEAGIPTIAMDTGDMKSSLMGSSEAAMRSSLKMITSVAGGPGRTLFIGTCNKISNLPPELRRRFALGTFYFDLPDAAEREAIWQIYIKSFNLSATQTAEMPSDEGWTGAEIKECCFKASEFGITLKAAGAYTIPVAVSAAESIQQLRTLADRKFLSASHEGMYEFNAAALAPAAPTGRRQMRV